MTTGGNQIATYVNEDGVEHGIYETITDFVDNADGTVTYTPESGPAVTVAKADLTDNGDGTFTFTNNDGSDVTIDISSLETNTIIQDTLTTGGNQIATYVNEDGVEHGIYETITDFVDNADGTVTYTPESGPAVTVAKADLTDNGDGTFTFTNNDGSDVTIDISSLETNTIIQDTLTTGGNQIATYVNEDGVEHGIYETCLLYTSPSPRDRTRSRMPSSA